MSRIGREERIECLNPASYKVEDERAQSSVTIFVAIKK